MTRSIRTTAGVALAIAASSAALTAGPAAAKPAPIPSNVGADTSAPVLSHHFVDIAAPRATIWRIFTSVNAWTTWQPHITAAALDTKGFRPGGAFTWTSEGFTVTSHIRAVSVGSRVVWRGTSGGITGNHEWLFRTTPKGTRVITTESFAGAPVEANVTQMQSILDDTLPFWLARLKDRSEARA
jgi:uncharacterized protein YndB with AHSA1/START domain